MFVTPRAEMRSLVRWGTFGLVAIGAFPFESLDGLSLLGVLIWAFIAANLLTFALSRRLILTMTVMTGFVIAYSQRLGDALAEGLVMDGVGVGPEWIFGALVALVLFLGTLLGASALIRRLLDRLARRREPASRDKLVAIDLGFLAFLAVTGLAAWTTGTWSYWGEAPVTEPGTIRFELSYPAALVGIVGHGVLVYQAGGGVLDRPKLRWAIGAVVFLLLFILQSRRLMVGTGVLVAVGWLLSERFAHGPMRRLLLHLGVLAGAVALFALASFGWREISTEQGVGVTARLERAITSLTSEEGLAQIESRLTYLWFDGAAQELGTEHGADLDGLALLRSDVARAVPRIILQTKDDVAAVTCETALEGFGLPEDLPCTPMSEGFLIAGLFGVMLAGLLWGLILGLGDVAVARGPGFASTFALIGVMPLLLLESGLFGFIDALRNGFIGLGVVGLGAAVVWYFGPRRVRARAGS